MDTNVTYFSEFKTLKDVSCPIISNDVGMKYKGGFTLAWQDSEVDFDYPSYGLRKTSSSRGLVYCDDASKLFSMGLGQIDISFSLSDDIINGVMESINGQDVYLLWGVNVGKTGGILPSISVSLTSEGIKFTIWSSAGQHSIVDTFTNVRKGDNILLKCVWSKDGIDDFGGYHNTTMYYNCNGMEIISNPPINNDSINGLNFCVGNTPFLNKNLDMVIGKLITYDNISYELEQEFYSSSSETSESESTTSTSSVSESSSSSSSEKYTSSSSFGGDSSSSSSIDSSSSSSIDSSSSSSEMYSSSSSSEMYSSSSSSSSLFDVCQKVAIYASTNNYPLYIGDTTGVRPLYTPVWADLKNLTVISADDAANSNYPCRDNPLLAAYGSAGKFYTTVGFKSAEPSKIYFIVDNGKVGTTNRYWNGQLRLIGARFTTITPIRTEGTFEYTISGDGQTLTWSAKFLSPFVNSEPVIDMYIAWEYIR